MRVIGFTIKKVSAERKKEFKERVEIKSGLNVDSIEKEELSISERPVLRFDFTFSLDYSSEAALIEIKGSILVQDEKEEGKEILKDWKKKKFDHPIKLPLFNFIMDKCNLKALQLEEELGLPFHIPFPKLAPAQPKSDLDSNNNPANYAG